MKPITEEGPQRAGRGAAPSATLPAALGGAAEVLPLLPSGIASGQQITDVIFYDPIAFLEGGDPPRRHSLGAVSGVPLSPKHQNESRGRQHSNTRRNAMEAVARDLGILSLRSRP